MKTLVRFILLALFITLTNSESCSKQIIKVTEKQLDSHASKFVHLGPAFPQHVFAITTRSIWLTRDFGAKWENLSPKLTQAKGSAFMGPLSIKKQPSTVYVYAEGSRDLWISRDQGSNFLLIQTPADVFTIEELQPHESDDGKFLLRAQGRECGQSYSDCKSYAWLVKLGSANNQNFKKIRGNIMQISWGKGNKIWVQSAQDESKPYWDSQRNLMHTIDEGEEWKTSLERCAGYAIVNNILIAAQGDQSMSLHIARQKGDERFFESKIPITLPQQGYSVVAADDDEVILHVNHGKDMYGNLYVSNANLTDFVLSLRDNKRNAMGYVDVLRVPHLHSVFIANQISPSPYDKEDATITKISWNRGGDWKPLKPPALDYDGRPFLCTASTSTGECTLNLFGPTEQESYGRLRSYWNAIGIVLGTGAVGHEIENSKDPSTLGTFLSRDAGSTWTHILPFPTTYSISNHGTMLLAFDNMKATDTLYYSITSGKSWSNCTLDSSLRVHSVESLRNGTGQHFLVRGERLSSGISYGSVLSVDLTGVHVRECQYEDYEEWVPLGADVTQPGCVMGRKRTFHRRKADAACFVPEGKDNEGVESICPCSFEDYECDYCYEKRPGSNICVEKKECGREEVSSDCTGTYPVSKGYRLVPGTVCDVSSGLNMLPEQVKCPKSGGTPGWVTFILVIVAIIGTIAFLLGLFLLFRRNESFNRFVTQATSRLPKRMIDPFRRVEFVRLNLDDEDSESGLLREMH